MKESNHQEKVMQLNETFLDTIDVFNKNTFNKYTLFFYLEIFSRLFR